MHRWVTFRLGVLGALGSVPFAAMLLWSLPQHEPHSTAALLASSVLLAMVLAACTRTWRRFFLVYFPLFILAAAYAAYSIWFGSLPGPTLAMLLIGATWEECAGLFITSPNNWLALPVIGAFVAYLWLAWRLPPLPIFNDRTHKAARLLLVSVVPVAAYAAYSPADLIDGAALNPIPGSLMFFGGQIPRTNAQMHAAMFHKVPYHAQRLDRDEEVHILVVGESARRGSWSVYGYARATTPYLNSLKGEAIFLQDAMADANLTAHAVPMILTGTPPDRFLTTTIQGNLLDLAKEAGYSTSWLVNQDIGVTIQMGISADHLEYPPDPKPSLFGSLVRDAALLPAYRRELARSGNSRLIAMHVMGSHWEYYRRYPPSFERFGDAHGLNAISLGFNRAEVRKALVEAYDNSVLYTDWFMQQVIEGARSLKVPATVTFIPDHGEGLALLDNGVTGHGDPTYQPSQFQIPAFIWVNDAYRQAHPQIVAALMHNASAEIRSHNVFYAMADLMGITWPDQRPELSYASPRFVPDTSRQHLAGGKLVTRPESLQRVAQILEPHGSK
jgi:glucan phosphoethanolaminetransferase (alkaline phosphatase superfamily)